MWGSQCEDATIESLQCKARAVERGDPFCGCVVPNMGRVAEQLDRLQVGVERGGLRRKGVDEHSLGAALEDPPRLAQTGLEIAPVMRRIPAAQEIEPFILEFQTF